MTTLVIVQAREWTKRLSGKMFADVMGERLIDHVLKRASQLGFPVILALPELEPGLDELGQFVKLAECYPKADRFVRIAGDCPLWDAEVGRQVLAQWTGCYMGTSLTMDGLGTEVFDRATLEAADRNETGLKRKHVTVWMRQARLRGDYYIIPGNYRWRVDDQAGLEFVRAVMSSCQWCRKGVPHHQNAEGSIGGPRRTPRWDLHQLETPDNRGGLVECAAYDIRRTRMGGIPNVGS